MEAQGKASNAKQEITRFVNTSLVDLVADQIRASIYSGKYLPGQKLIVREISEELGVSHTPVKDALNRLISEGYVEAPPRKSMQVKQFTSLDFLENLEIRLVCEIYVVDPIIENAKKNKSAVKDLRKIWKLMADAVSCEPVNYEAWVSNETKFHHTYIQLCDNRNLTEIYRNLDTNKQSFFAYLNHYSAPYTKEAFQQDIQEHQEILEAIAAFDKPRYIEAVTSHVLHTCRKYAVDEASRQKLEELSERIKRFGTFVSL